jgi:hypothetical protein
VSPEWVVAIASAGTLVVIAASAIAALLQLRHMRSGNAISLLTAYNSEFDTAEFQMAFAYVRGDLPERLKSNEVLDDLVQAPPFVGEYAKIRTIANFFEDMGAFVLTRLLDERIVCLLYAENVTSAWRSISPVAGLLRYKLDNPAVWENFEYLAYLAKRFSERHPRGQYPERIQRMPLDGILVARWKSRHDASGTARER